MAILKSPAWEKAIFNIELLRHEAIELTGWEFDDNVPYDYDVDPRVFGASDRIIDIADGETNIDTSPIARLEQQLCEWRREWLRRNDYQPTPISDITDTLRQCVPIFDRLRRCGVVDEEPERVDGTQRKIKPQPPTLDVIRDIQAGLDVNALVEKHRISAVYARKISQRLRNDEYLLDS